MELTKLSVNINKDTADAIKEMAEARGISITEVIRRAISIAVFIDEEIRAGRRIHTVRADGKKRRELIIR